MKKFTLVLALVLICAFVWLTLSSTGGLKIVTTARLEYRSAYDQTMEKSYYYKDRVSGKIYYKHSPAFAGFVKVTNHTEDFRPLSQGTAISNEYYYTRFFSIHIPEDLRPLEVMECKTNPYVSFVHDGNVYESVFEQYCGSSCNSPHEWVKSTTTLTAELKRGCQVI